MAEPTQDEADSFKLVSQGHDENASPPANVDLPSVTVNGAVVASCVVGDTLACTLGNWQDEPTGYGHQWLAGSAIVGDGLTYTAQAGDAGQNILCSVTAMNTVGSTTVQSNAVMVTAAGG